MTIPAMDTFGTAINCIDGRAQTPVTEWIRLHCNLKYVDMITTPGADQALSSGSGDRVERVRRKVRLSVERHLSPVVAVAGHFDCLANPCEFDKRRDQIIRSAGVVSSWKFGVRVLGLYVNEWGSVDVICDTDAEQSVLRSFL